MLRSAIIFQKRCESEDNNNDNNENRDNDNWRHRQLKITTTKITTTQTTTTKTATTKTMKRTTAKTMTTKRCNRWLKCNSHKWNRRIGNIWKIKQMKKYQNNPTNRRNTSDWNNAKICGCGTAYTVGSYVATAEDVEVARSKDPYYLKDTSALQQNMQQTKNYNKHTIIPNYVIAYKTKKYKNAIQN